MKLRRLALVAAGGLGTMAAANAVLAHRAGRLDPPLAGMERTYRFRGTNVSYTEAGDGPDVVLFHGIHAAASSHEWAPVWEQLAEDYHVVAPDLPGFGRSDRPPIGYDAEFYTDFVGSFSADVAPGATCVGSSLTGAYAALAQRDRGPFSRLMLVCPTATTASERRPWRRRLVRSPVVGTALFNLLTSTPSIRWFEAEQVYYDRWKRPETSVEYQWRSAHQPGARFAPASFVSGYLDPTEPLSSVLAAVDAPVTLVWGRDADLPPLATGRALADAADARLVVFDRAKLLPHVEHPDEFQEVLAEELIPAA